MEEEQIIIMIDKYLTGEASAEEVHLLNTWFDNFNNKPSLLSSLSSNELDKLSAKMFLVISDAINTIPVKENQI